MKTYSTLKIAASVAALAAFTIASYSATPTQPATKAPAVANPANDPEFRRIIVIPPKAMPFPVMRFETNADGSYTKVGATGLASGNFKYAFEKIGDGKYRIAVGRFLNKGAWVWDVNEKDTLLGTAKTDPQIMAAIRKCAAESGYTPESFLQRFGEKEQYRVSIGASRYALPATMTTNEVLQLIANRDPSTQSLIDGSNRADAATLCGWDDWENRPGIYKRPSNVERVGIDTIAKELLETKAAPDAEVSLRKEVERLGVKHRRQIGDTCTIYSAYHLLDYCMKRGDIQTFSFEEFKEKAAQSHGGRRTYVGGNALLTILANKEPGIKIRVRHLPSFAMTQTSYNPQGCERIRDRFIQHELEAGRPIWLSLGFHAVMLVGIQPTNQPNMAINTITALDSTGFGDKDKGYSHWSRLEVSELFTIEFVKQATPTQRTTHTP